MVVFRPASPYLEVLPSFSWFQTSPVPSTFLWFVLAGLILLGILLAITWIANRRTAKSLNDLAHRMQLFAEGNWEQRAPLNYTPSVTELAEAFNEIAGETAHLYNQIQASAENQANEAEALAQIAQSIRLLGAPSDLTEGAAGSSQATGQPSERSQENLSLRQTLELINRRFGIAFSALFILDLPVREKQTGPSKTGPRVAVLKAALGPSDIGKRFRDAAYRVDPGANGSLLAQVVAVNAPVVRPSPAPGSSYLAPGGLQSGGSPAAAGSPTGLALNRPELPSTPTGNGFLAPANSYQGKSIEYPEDAQPQTPAALYEAGIPIKSGSQCIGILVFFAAPTGRISTNPSIPKQSAGLVESASPIAGKDLPERQIKTHHVSMPFPKRVVSQLEILSSLIGLAIQTNPAAFGYPTSDTQTRPPAPPAGIREVTEKSRVVGNGLASPALAARINLEINRLNQAENLAQALQIGAQALESLPYPTAVLLPTSLAHLARQLHLQQQLSQPATASGAPAHNPVSQKPDERSFRDQESLELAIITRPGPAWTSAALSLSKKTASEKPAENPDQQEAVFQSLVISRQALLPYFSPTANQEDDSRAFAGQSSSIRIVHDLRSTLQRGLNNQRSPLPQPLIDYPRRQGCKSAVYLPVIHRHNNQSEQPSLDYDILEDRPLHEYQAPQDKLNALLIAGLLASDETYPQGLLQEALLQPGELLNALQNLIESLSSTLERLQTRQAVARSLAELQSLWKISLVVGNRGTSAQTGLKSLYSEVQAQVEQLMGQFSSFAIGLLETPIAGAETGPADTSVSARHNRINFVHFTEQGRQVQINPIPLGEGLSSIVIRSRQALLLEKDAQARAAALGAKVVGQLAKSWLGVPLLLQGRVIGIMIVQDFELEGRFDQHDLRLLSALAAQVALAVNNARLLEATRRQAGFEKKLNQISSQISSSVELQDILRITTQELAALLGAHRARIRIQSGSPDPSLAASQSEQVADQGNDYRNQDMAIVQDGDIPEGHP